MHCIFRSLTIKRNKKAIRLSKFSTKPITHIYNKWSLLLQQITYVNKKKWSKTSVDVVFVYVRRKNDKNIVFSIFLLPKLAEILPANIIFFFLLSLHLLFDLRSSYTQCFAYIWKNSFFLNQSSENVLLFYPRNYTSIP